MSPNQMKIWKHEIKPKENILFRIVDEPADVNRAIHLAVDSQNSLWRVFSPLVSHSRPMDIFPFHRNGTSRSWKTMRLAAWFTGKVVSTQSTIHKATGLTAPGCSMALTGTIPVEQNKSLKPWMGEQSLNTVPAGGRQSGGLVHSAVNCGVMVRVWTLIKGTRFKTKVILIEL